jgi:hypothetical protein
VPSSTFSAASSFCLSPGTQTATDDGDTYVAQNTNVSGGTSATVQVQPNTSSVRRAYIHFALPTRPHDCNVTSATLTIVTTTSKTGEFIRAYQSAATWGGDVNLTWATQPGSTGSPTASVASTATNVPLNLNVASIVANLYAGTNTGFVIEDAGEGTSASGTNAYGSRENNTAANRPSLSITFG